LNTGVKIPKIKCQILKSCILSPQTWILVFVFWNFFQFGCKSSRNGENFQLSAQKTHPAEKTLKISSPAGIPATASPAAGLVTRQPPQVWRQVFFRRAKRSDTPALLLAIC
jgi:hypothetical protein